MEYRQPKSLVVVKEALLLLFLVIVPYSAIAQERTDLAEVLEICSSNGLSFEARVEAFQNHGWSAVERDAFDLATNVIGDAGISFVTTPINPEHSLRQERAGSRSHIGSQIRKPNSAYFKTAVFHSPTELNAFVNIYYIKQGNSVRCNYGGNDIESGRALMRELNGNTLPDIGYYARRFVTTIESFDSEAGHIMSTIFFRIGERREIESTLTEPLQGVVQLVVITRISKE